MGGGLLEARRTHVRHGYRQRFCPCWFDDSRQVIAAFEDRMNDRAEVDVARLLEDSVDSQNSSTGNNSSPTRCDTMTGTPYLYAWHYWYDSELCVCTRDVDWRIEGDQTGISR